MTIRSIHRDLGYFYVGLIISFAFSGILMNHRDYWHPEKYTIETKEFQTQLPKESEITETFVKGLVSDELKIKDKFRRHTIKNEKLRINYERHEIEIDIKTGKGEATEFRKTPVISQMMGLHKNTSNWWIYYSDVFGLSLIAIAVTGMFVFPKGKLSFKARGWKLAVAGLLFPLIFLLFLA
ncbi:MAG: PepSY-associated TM helix domain-containing protein [Raineya sp.]|jgi:hypothetical protein|nr:PepSY-associated TM helix domain-containing protein [Raineya sp.]